MGAKKGIGASVGSAGGSEKELCFVVAPIGEEGSQEYAHFKEVMDYVIKPAVEASGYGLKVMRADDIAGSGSIIKDILDSLLTSYVVIADLTKRNPNVFYELGVRHALRPRTILIAQSTDDIPFDLRDYRTIIYDTSAKGAGKFKKALCEYLGEIQKEPERPDNPVLDRFPSLLEEKTAKTDDEVRRLRNELDKVLKEPASKRHRSSTSGDSVRIRVSRITDLVNGEDQRFSRSDGRFSRGEKGKEIKHQLPTSQGDFVLYFLERGESISGMWYLSVHEDAVDVEKELSDMRVLMGRCSQGQDAECVFIIVTADDLSEKKPKILGAFEKMKGFLKEDQRKHFSLQVWDETGLLEKEKELGLKVDI